MVRAALLIALWFAAGPASACRLALVLALDVSSSVDAREDQQQRQGLAAALLAPEVVAAFLSSPDPVALEVFEWSGRSHQREILPWMLIETEADLQVAADALGNSTRRASGLPTALGYALAYAATQLDQAPPCLFQTIDVSGDGVNNEGFGPRAVYATFPLEEVIVNGLVIAQNDRSVEPYYQSQVIRGAGAFVEVALDFAEYEQAMRRKLIREVSAQIIGRNATAERVRG